ncbi:MAG: nucleotidyltransferase family protein, partial [Gaiellaceae bacterium]
MVGVPQTTRRDPRAWRPTGDQILLLRSALFEEDAAREAWARWRAANTPESADPGSARLFPLAYRNLVSAGIPEPDLAQLRSAYRAAWFRNQLLLKRAAEALQALNEAGIPTLVLKGVALAVAHY